MFNLKDTLAVSLEGRKISGTLIGIDSYVLDDFQGGRQEWISYTLISDKKGAFSRYWIIHRATGWFLSIEARKKKLLPRDKIVPERSGIAKIAFKGDKGVSTPAAALLAYKVGRDTYYTIERFSDSEIMFFSSRKIHKPRVEKSPKE